MVKRKRGGDQPTLFVTLRYNTSLQKYLHPSIDKINIHNIEKFSLDQDDSNKEDENPNKRRLRNSIDNNTIYKEATLPGFSSKDEEYTLDLKLKHEIEFSKHDSITTKKSLKKLNLDINSTDLRFFQFLDNHRKQHIHQVTTTNKLYVSGTEYTNLGMVGYICGFCFKCFQDEFQYTYHTQFQRSCDSRLSSLDDVIYDDQQGIMVKQLDGLTNSHTLQRLSTLSKLFISHKLNNASDIIKFEFYLLYVNNEFVGYFSKEKNTNLWNLSCILIVKKSGLSFRGIKSFEMGQLLIHFSYQLSILDESFLGSPEKPFSDFGLLAYRKYYRFRLVKCLLEDMKYKEGGFEAVEVSMEDISSITGMVKNDIVFGMESLGIFQYNKDLKKIKMDYNLLVDVQSSKEYKHWHDSIDQFDKKWFKDFFRKRLKKLDDNLEVGTPSVETINSINNKGSSNWIDVNNLTKLTLYKPLSDKDHETFINTFDLKNGEEKL